MLWVLTLHLLEYNIAHLVQGWRLLSVMASLGQAEVLLHHGQALTRWEYFANIVKLALIVLLVRAARQDLVELRAGQVFVWFGLVIDVLADVGIYSVLIVLLGSLLWCQVAILLILVYEEYLVLRRERRRS